MYHSPLRYPGGKTKITPLVSKIIEGTGIRECTYIEPFAGGAGVALSLLFNGKADRIVINDYDKAVYSFWRAVKEDGDELIQMIEETPITIDEWLNQKRIFYRRSNNYSVDLAFSTFFLNRTNRSGIMNAGPIGGYSQTGNYKIDARFNKVDLIKRIRKIMEYRDFIHVYNKDIIKFIKLIYPKFSDDAFIYFDPPYYNKGKDLYKNFLDASDHKRISQSIIENVHSDWIVTYDRCDEILDIYSDLPKAYFDLNYSLANNGKGTEVLIMKNPSYLPEQEELKRIGFDMKLN